MRKYSWLGMTVMILAIIGALNWGLIGFFNWNLVDAIFRGGAREETSAAARVVYAIVGLSGLAALFFLPRTRDVTTGGRVGSSRAVPA